MKLNVELVTPTEVLFSENVTMVVVPGSEGVFGVLPNHAPIISSIENGVIQTEGRDSGDEDIFVAGGFVEVSDNRCTILAEQAIHIKDINVDAAKKRVTELEFAIEKAKSDDDKNIAEKEKSVVLASIKAATGADSVE